MSRVGFLPFYLLFSVGLTGNLACGSAGGALGLCEENDAFSSSSQCWCMLLARLRVYSLRVRVMNR